MYMTEDTIKVYSPSDIAMILQLNPATLRKYSQMLERQGYQIGRNSQGHRYYQDKDIITIRNVISGVGSDVSLEESVRNVVHLQSGSTVTNDTNIAKSANDSDISELKDMIRMMAEKMDEQQEEQKRQQEVLYEKIEQLSAKVDEQQKLLDEDGEEQDELVKSLYDKIDQLSEQVRNQKEYIDKSSKNVMNYTNARIEHKLEVQKKEKGFFSRLFGK